MLACVGVLEPSSLRYLRDDCTWVKGELGEGQEKGKTSVKGAEEEAAISDFGWYGV